MSNLLRGLILLLVVSLPRNLSASIEYDAPTPQLAFAAQELEGALTQAGRKNLKVALIVRPDESSPEAFTVRSVGPDRVEVTGSDLYDKFLINAKKIIELNKVKVKLVKSDLFRNIKGRFDVITFNPPFKHPKDNDTYKLVDKFLKESPDTRLLMVGNPCYSNLKKIEGIIARNNYITEDTVCSLLNPVKIQANTINLVIFFS